MQIDFLPKRQLLAVETDGFSLRAAIVTAKKDKTWVEHTVESRLTGLEASLDQLLGDLRKVSPKLPPRAVLVMPEVVPVVIDLPVNPKQPRKPMQMEEMIRWEVEPYLAQQAAPRTMGAILIGQGVLSRDQLQRILTELEQRQQVRSGRIQGGSWQAPRFGDLAVEMGLVTPKQLEEAVIVQKEGSLPHSGDEVICGWSAQGAGSKNNKDSLFKWLACGVNRSLRDRWHAAFSRQGLHLTGIYPLLSCSAAALNGRSSESSIAVLDLQPGAIGCTCLAEGAVQTVRLYHTVEGSPLSDIGLELMGKDISSVWLGGRGCQERLVLEEVTKALKRTVKMIPVELDQTAKWNKVQPPALTSMVGAARHAMSLTGGSRTVSVPGSDPAPPLWQRLSILWLSAVGVVLLIIAILEISMAIRRRATQTDGIQIGETMEIAAALGAARKESVELNKKQIFMTEVLPRRAQFISSLLDLFTRIASEEIVLEKMIEDEQQEILVVGWALTDAAAQQFVRALTDGVKPFGLQVTHPRVMSQTGRLGISGFGMEMRLVPLTKGGI